MYQQQKRQNRISLIAGCLLVVSTLLVGVSVFLVMLSHAKELTSRSLEATLLSNVSLVEAEVDAGLASSALIASRPLLVAQIQLANAGLMDETMRLSLNNISKSFLSPKIRGFALFDKDGHELARAGNFAQNPEMVASLNLPGQQQLLWHKKLILHSVADMKAAGQTVGQVAIDFDMLATTKIVSDSSRQSETTELLLCAPFGLEAQCLPTNRNPRVITLPRISANGDELPIFSAFRGQKGFSTAIDYRGQNVAAAYAPLGNLGLGMVLKVDSRELNAPVWEQLRYLVPIAVIGVAFALLCLRWLLYPIVVRLERSEANGRELNSKLRSSEMLSRRITENMAEGIITITSDNVVLSANAAALQLYGYERSELIGTDVASLVPERYREQYRQTVAALGSQHEAFNIHGKELRCLRQDGTEFSSSMSFSDAVVDGRRLFTSMIVDISERKRVAKALLASEAQLREITDNVPAMITYLDSQQRFVFHNRAFEETLGLSFEQINTQALEDVAGPEMYALIRGHVDQALQGYPVSYERVHVTPNGVKRNYVIRYFPRYGEGEEVSKVLGFYSLGSDVTELKQAADKLSYLANNDALTGLPNRLLFKERLEQAMATAQAQGSLVAVVFLDLVRFKNVNDTLGHDAGDQLLKEVAQRLLRTVRSSDTVARISGDEFTVVLTDVGNADDAARAAQRILQTFEPPFHVAGRNLFMGASLGIAMFPLDTDDAGEMLSFSDLAMYSAKAAGGNNYQFYATEMTLQAAGALALENDLRRALERDEFFLNYQPIVDAGGCIVGAEALLRWQHGRHGLIPPGSFIALAETTGLIVPIGEWVLRQACLQAKAWRKPNGALLRMAVNVSPRQFKHESLAVTIKKILDESGLVPPALDIEITEGVLMQGETSEHALFERLSELGLSFSIDDFGTGYSNLAYLTRFQVGTLKIALPFIRDITTSPSNAKLVKTIIGMAHSLGMKTVAEGVETPAQREFLVAHGCDFMQGYYFSRPLSPEAFTALLDAGEPLTGNHPGG